MIQILIRVFCLLAALGLLGGFDYFAANTLSTVDPVSEIARMRLDDEVRIKRHLRICAQSEIISRATYELTAALSGYGLTKGTLFEQRFNAAAHNLPAKVIDLKHICSDNKFQLVLTDSVDKAVGEILLLHRDGKDVLDSSQSHKFKFKDLYADLRPKSAALELALMKLKESDFLEVNRALKVPPSVPPQIGTVMLTLALINAIYGCVVGGIFVASLSWMKKDNKMDDNFSVSDEAS